MLLRRRFPGPESILKPHRTGSEPSSSTLDEEDEDDDKSTASSSAASVQAKPRTVRFSLGRGKSGTSLKEVQLQNLPPGGREPSGIPNKPLISQEDFEERDARAQRLTRENAELRETIDALREEMEEEREAFQSTLMAIAQQSKPGPSELQKRCERLEADLQAEREAHALRVAELETRLAARTATLEFEEALMRKTRLVQERVEAEKRYEASVAAAKELLKKKRLTKTQFDQVCEAAKKAQQLA